MGLRYRGHPSAAGHRRETAAQRGSRSRAALLAAVAGCRQPPATQACREVKEEIGGGGWVGASWAHAGQAAESAAMRVPSCGVRGGGRSSDESGRVRGRKTMRTYRAMPPHGRLKLQPPKKMKISARSLQLAVAAEVARRPPGRTASKTAEAKTALWSHWLGSGVVCTCRATTAHLRGHRGKGRHLISPRTPPDCRSQRRGQQARKKRAGMRPPGTRLGGTSSGSPQFTHTG